MNLIGHAMRQVDPCVFRMVTVMGVLCLSTGAVQGFEAWEHEDLGTIALNANLVDLQARASSAEEERSNRIARAITDLTSFHEGLSVVSNLPPVTYGDIVRLVDYMNDNYSMLHTRKTRSGVPSSPADANIRYLQELSSDSEALAGASHANQNHFQGRALHTFWFWHKQAVETATEGNLWGALLLNAYADHFLQDSFAPGHIIAPRDENSHDLYAVMIHDLYNERGMIYRIGDPRQCRDALRKLLPLAGGTFAPTHNRDPEMTVMLYADAITRLMNADGPTNVLCFGDGLINRNQEQAALVGAYVVQSVSDVIESYLVGHEVNSFPDYEWRQRFGGSRLGQVEIIDVRQSFGNLSCIDRDVEHDKMARNLKILTSVDGRVAWQPVSSIEADIVSPLALASMDNPAFGFSLGMQTLVETTDTRPQLKAEIETMILGGRWDYLKEEYPGLKLPSWPDQFALTLGYSGLYDTQSQANGIIVRLVAPITRLDAQFSLFAGARYYEGDNRSSGWRDFEGIRLEWGMHLGNLFFGLGRDHYPARDGDIRDGLSVEAGLSFTLPWSRIKR